MDNVNALLVMALSFAVFALGYRFYGRLMDRLMGVRPQLPGPAHARNDGRDFVPTKRWVLFGHHFASIAGLGPIMGPAVAVYWGWLPALLWVVFGSILLGAVHDYTTLILSLRHKGRGIGEVTGDYLGRRARFAFLWVIFFLLALGMGLFVLTISSLFVRHYPEAVAPVFLLMGLAVLMGFAVHRWRVPLLPATAVAVALVFGCVVFGARNPVYVHQYFLPGGTGGELWRDIEHKAGAGWFENHVLLTAYNGAAQKGGFFLRSKDRKAPAPGDAAVKGVPLALLLEDADKAAALKNERSALNARLKSLMDGAVIRVMRDKGVSPEDAYDLALKETPEARAITEKVRAVTASIDTLERSRRDIARGRFPEASVAKPLVIRRYVGEGKDRTDIVAALAAEQARLEAAGSNEDTARVVTISHTRPGDLTLYFRAAKNPGAVEAVEDAAKAAITFWVVALLVYALLASVLPVWMLLQPRDYINSWILYAGLAAMVLGLIVWQAQALFGSAPPPNIVAPAYTGAHAEDLGVGGMPLIVPFLFIVVACGAISGFHSLVSSGTSARQLDREADAKPIAFGGMLLEGALAVIVVIACTVGVSQAGWIHKAQGVNFGAMDAASAISRFIDGGAHFMHELLGPAGVGVAACAAFLALVCVTFAVTTLDSATRLLRYNIEEFGTHFGGPIARSRSAALRNDAGAPLPRGEGAGSRPGMLAAFGGVLRNPGIASILAVLAIAFFSLVKIDGKFAGLHLLALFGSTNQLLAALGLVVVTIWFRKTGRPTAYTLAPLVIMLALSGWALIDTLLVELSRDLAPGAARNFILIGVSLALLLLAAWIAIEALLAWNSAAKATETQEQDKNSEPGTRSAERKRRP